MEIASQKFETCANHGFHGNQHVVRRLTLDNLSEKFTGMDSQKRNRILDLIKNVAARVSRGSAGPSGLDADAWTRMLTCFKQSSDRLCAALSCAARALCTQDRTADDMEGLTAARLIPLDKQPGVRPIAVGEVFRRIICKAIMRVVEMDVLKVTAPIQVCVGVPSACEAAVHSMERLFQDNETEGLLLVDATKICCTAQYPEDLPCSCSGVHQHLPESHPAVCLRRW